MSDTQDQDKTMFVRPPGANAEPADSQGEPAVSPDQTSRIDQTAMPPTPAERAPSLDTVDFDVTAGFGDEAPPASDEFFDITQGAESPVADGAGGPPPAEPVSPSPAAVTAPTPAVTPAPPSPPPEAAAGRGGSLVLIVIIVVAVVAAALWLAMR